jgi:NAD(P)-dependent dehydrogenase (short-subunit alcohol dehydrogenase family)
VWVGSAGSRSLDAGDDQLDAMVTLAMRATNKVVAGELGPGGVTANAVLRSPAASLDEVAATVAFVCSEGAGYLTGVTITVDGGDGSAMF